MNESEEEKRLRKLKKDAKDKIELENEYEDKPPRGRHEKNFKEKDDD